MKDKKNIDNIFNEGFKNFEASPSPRVWENIQTALKKEKKERKVIPLWIKLGGVAALVALLFTVGNTVYNSSNSIAPKITNEDVHQLENNEPSINEVIENTVNASELASEDETLKNDLDQTLNASDKNAVKENSTKNASNKILSNSSEKALQTVVAATNSEKNTSVKNTSDKETNRNINFVEKQLSEEKLKEVVAVSDKTSEKEKTTETTNEVEESTNFKTPVAIDANKEVIAVTEKTENNTSEENRIKTEAEVLAETAGKKSIFDAIAENEEVAVLEENKKEKPDHRWNVAPNVAPVYYSSFGNGSSIDQTFSDNPQQGDVNMSYGVQVSYALNKRLSVRSGVNNVDLSYSTKGIEVGTGPVAVALRSVDYGGRQIVVTALDRGTLANSVSSGEFGEIMPKSTQGEARLIQNINYYEVPLELKYALVDSKFGVNLIGGVSTLFLGNNEISVKADNFTNVLGEANNLSSLSFSTNIGLGLDYKLSKKFTFNIEPMFKYQLNPYTDSSVNFKPYYLGVYSGLSFRF